MLRFDPPVEAAAAGIIDGTSQTAILAGSMEWHVTELATPFWIGRFVECRPGWVFSHALPAEHNRLSLKFSVRLRFPIIERDDTIEPHLAIAACQIVIEPCAPRSAK